MSQTPAGRSLGNSLLLAGLAAACAWHSAARAQFQIEEATIEGIQSAIRDGETTCVGVVQAYIERAQAYNGVCTALVTADGADVAPANGYVRAGAPLAFPTKTVKASTIFPEPRSIPRACRSSTAGWSGRYPIPPS